MQSQPCHWRNLKAVTKRDLSNNTSTSFKSHAAALIDRSSDTTDKPETSLSENVNLFQSLRVLQEGETDESTNNVYSNSQKFENFKNQTCLKTSTFSALAISLSLIVGMLSIALLIACSRLKQRSKASLYDSYITHKGQID